MVNIGLVGCAHIHTPGFVNNLKKRTDAIKVTKAWDPNPARSAKWGAEIGATIVNDAAEIWNDKEISAVIITSEKRFTFSPMSGHRDLGLLQIPEEHGVLRVLEAVDGTPVAAQISASDTSVCSREGAASAQRLPGLKGAPSSLPRASSSPKSAPHASIPTLASPGNARAAAPRPSKTSP